MGALDRLRVVEALADGAQQRLGRDGAKETKKLEPIRKKCKKSSQFYPVYELEIGENTL